MASDGSQYISARDSLLMSDTRCFLSDTSLASGIAFETRFLSLRISATTSFRLLMADPSEEFVARFLGEP